jgi:hypothetical protein
MRFITIEFYALELQFYSIHVSTLLMYRIIRTGLEVDRRAVRTSWDAGPERNSCILGIYNTIKTAARKHWTSRPATAAHFLALPSRVVHVEQPRGQVPNSIRVK